MRVLVTGAGGFLGKKILRVFREHNVKVVATEKTAKNEIIQLDVTDKKMAELVLKEQKPDVVVHTAAVTAVDWCEEHRKETFEINVQGTKNVALACKKIGAKMVLISTDYVFDGTKKTPYTEEDKTNPPNVYAESKLEAEKIVQKELRDFIIGRVTVLYGYNDDLDKKCYPMHVINSLAAQKEFECFVDQYSNPTLVNDIALAVLKLAEKNQSGLFHMTGSENINRLDFAKKIAQVFGLDESLLRKGAWEKSGFVAKRPPFLNISIKKLQNLGIKMSDTTQGLLKMKEDMKVLGNKKV